jgi:hypothetical protein
MIFIYFWSPKLAEGDLNTAFMTIFDHNTGFEEKRHLLQIIGENGDNI